MVKLLFPISSRLQRRALSLKVNNIEHVLMNGGIMILEDIEKLKEVSEIDRMKLRLEYEHLQMEKTRSRMTVLSILIPVIVVMITVVYGMLAENEKANVDFQIKAAEIVMNAPTPESATVKAIVLHELFPDRLPENFKDKMIEMYGTSLHDQTTQSK